MPAPWTRTARAPTALWKSREEQEREISTFPQPIISWVSRVQTPRASLRSERPGARETERSEGEAIGLDCLTLERRFAPIRLTWSTAFTMPWNDRPRSLGTGVHNQRYAQKKGLEAAKKAFLSEKKKWRLRVDGTLGPGA